MKVIKQLNNNAVVALDNSGSEVVVLGSGVGFGKAPYELNDLSKIERTFYELEPRYIEMLSGLDKSVVYACADLIDQADLILESELNPNLVITLADHISFVMERMEKGINITAPLAYDIKQLYPNEFFLGKIGIDIIEKYTGVRFPESEAINIALHFINGQSESEDLHSVMTSLRIINDVSEIIETHLHRKIDRESFAYNRFLSHLRYMMKRMETGDHIDDDNGAMLSGISLQYPEIYVCANKVAEYLESVYGSKCYKTELLYLTLHINRMKEKSE